MEIILNERAKEMNPVLQIPKIKDLKKQINMLNITENDLAIAQLLKPYVKENIYNIVEEFYNNIKKNNHLIEIIEKFGSIKRHKAALREHITNMFTGVIDEKFFKKREIIANVHLKIGLTQEWYIVSFESIFRALVDTIQMNFNKKENIYIATKVINQLINLEIQVVLRAYNKEMNILKEKEEKATEKIMYMAFYDELTGLPKRSKISSDLEQLIISDKKFAIINMEIRHARFLGEPFQNELKHLFFAIRERLNTALSGLDYQLGKFDGLEFVIIIKGYGTHSDLVTSVNKILNSMKLPIQLFNREIYLTTSLGITTYPNETQSAETLLRYANLAMNEQKKLKQNGYLLFTPALKTKIRNRINLEDYLRKAIAKNELELHYQPQIDSMENQLIGLEALVRWNHPQKGMVSPGQFIPIAEETGIIYDITKWVIKEVCHQLRKWHHKNYKKVPVWINISSYQFYDPNFVQNIRESLKEAKVNPKYLGLEITESAMMDANISEYQLNELNELGVQISLDDFGTGYSSLSYLHRLPVHGLKIDRSFIMNITENDNHKAIVSSIITLAKQLRLNIIAEGVETEEQLNYLKKLNCHLIQGYFFSRPLTLENLEKRYLIPTTGAASFKNQ